MIKYILKCVNKHGKCVNTCKNCKNVGKMCKSVAPIIPATVVYCHSDVYPYPPLRSAPLRCHEFCVLRLLLYRLWWVRELKILRKMCFPHFTHFYTSFLRFFNFPIFLHIFPTFSRTTVAGIIDARDRISHTF